jgi:geranylgeranyl pyrophosphate synthase
VNTALKDKLNDYTGRVDLAIDKLLPACTTRPLNLHSAMRYSIQAGGKRIRPTLLLIASELFDNKSDPTAAAVAIECLHTYTLIHDDLPAIDNSELRRGSPSCHTKFNEATAILAGDSLLTHAFRLLSEQYSAEPELAILLIKELSKASSSEYLIAGQQEDIENEGQVIDADTLLYIHANKTAALLSAALKMGLYFCQPSESQLTTIAQAGYHLGLAFQIVDDILDATSSSDLLGKPVGNDAAIEKSTYVILLGLEGARLEAHRHTQEAINALESLGGNNLTLLSLVSDLEKRIN